MKKTIAIVICVIFIQKSYSKTDVDIFTDIQKYSAITVYEVIGKNTVMRKSFQNQSLYDAYDYTRENKFPEKVDKEKPRKYILVYDEGTTWVVDAIGTKAAALVDNEIPPLSPNQRFLGTGITPDAVIGIIYKNSLAEKAGLKIGDVIYNFNDHEISSLSDLTTAITNAKPNKKISMWVLRGSKRLTFYVEFDK